MVDFLILVVVAAVIIFVLVKLWDAQNWLGDKLVERDAKRDAARRNRRK